MAVHSLAKMKEMEQVDDLENGAGNTQEEDVVNDTEQVVVEGQEVMEESEEEIVIVRVILAFFRSVLGPVRAFRWTQTLSKHRCECSGNGTDL